MAKKTTRPATPAATRARLSKAYDRFQERVYREVRAAIIATCDKHGWDFLSLYWTRLFPRGADRVDDNEIDEKNPVAKALLKLVFDADDMCGFPDCKYENGVWMP